MPTGQALGQDQDSVQHVQSSQVPTQGPDGSNKTNTRFVFPPKQKTIGQQEYQPKKREEAI